MSISSHSAAQAAIADSGEPIAPSKTPPKRRTVAVADSKAVPEPS